jgi:hypothetical protein
VNKGIIGSRVIKVEDEEEEAPDLALMKKCSFGPPTSKLKKGVS